MEIESLPPDAALVMKGVRAHWGIENSLHWALDVIFREDDSSVRIKNAADNLAPVRKITYNCVAWALVNAIHEPTRRDGHAPKVTLVESNGAHVVYSRSRAEIHAFGVTPKVFRNKVTNALDS